MKIKVGFIYGGKSVEHEISVISAVQAMNHLDTNKYDIVPIYITKDLQMYTGGMLKDIESYKDASLIKKYAKKVNLINSKDRIILQSTKWFKKEVDYIDIAFPIVHGNGTEDGSIAGFLETIGIPYIGSKVVSSAIGQDKVIQKQIFSSSNIPTTNYIWFFDNEYYDNQETILKNINKLTYPLVVKPATLGSSIGISFVKAKDELQEAIELAISYDNKIIVEEAINNLCEVNQSVLGTYDYYETSQIEEVIKEDEILSYKDKYLGSAKTSSKGIASTRRIIPARINEKLSKEIDEISKKVYRNLNCSGVVRIDYLIDTKKKEVYVNEINTIPGSLAYYLWEGKGTSYEELLENLITTTIKDYKKKMKKIASFETNILSNYNSQGLKGIKK